MLTALAGWMPAPAGAQGEYPNRPVTLVVPFPAGGSTDLVARLVASKMTPVLGQQIVMRARGRSKHSFWPAPPHPAGVVSTVP
jgi:tripartite-type tricarboxylate transporter receptor subunit TctC